MNDDSLTILLIEDNDMDVQLTEHALQLEAPSIQIHVARDGEEALELLKQIAEQLPMAGALPRLILLDLNLPKLSGFDVLRRVKENPATRIIPVVVLTSSSDEDDMFETYSLGANSYLQKPVSFEQFRKLIRQLGSYWLEANLFPSPTGVQRHVLQMTRS